MAYKIDFNSLQTISEDDALKYILSKAREFGFPSTSFQSGSIGYSLLRTIAHLTSIMSEGMSLLANNIYLNTAVGQYLDLIGSNHFDEDRIQQTQTILQPSITNTGVQTLNFGAGTLTFKVYNGTDLSGNDVYIDFTNDSPINIAPSGTVTDVTFTSTTFGEATRVSQSNQPVWSPAQPFLQFNVISVEDGYFSIVRDGQDQETDDNYRERCINKWGTLSANGPEAYYEYWAKTATYNDETIGVTRVYINKDTANILGLVYVYVATLTGEEISVGAIQAIQDSIMSQNALCSTAYVDNATQVQTLIPLYIKHNINDTEASIKNTIYNTLVTLYGNLPIGGTKVDGKGYLFASEVIDAVMNIDGIVDCTIGTISFDGSESRTVDASKNIILQEYDVLIPSTNQQASMTLSIVK